MTKQTKIQIQLACLIALSVLWMADGANYQAHRSGASVQGLLVLPVLFCGVVYYFGRLWWMDGLVQQSNTRQGNFDKTYIKKWQNKSGKGLIGIVEHRVCKCYVVVWSPQYSTVETVYEKGQVVEENEDGSTTTHYGDIEKKRQSKKKVGDIWLWDYPINWSQLKTLSIEFDENDGKGLYNAEKIKSLLTKVREERVLKIAYSHPSPTPIEIPKDARKLSLSGDGI